VSGWQRPLPIVIAAPSGAGKTSLARALVERNPDVEFSISATTRPRREYERDGVDYYFVDDAGFDRMVESGELLEWAWVHGRRYGTPERGVRAALAGGKTVMLDIDVQGALQMRARVPEAVLIFVLPPSADELLRRLSGRGSEPEQERVERMRNARAELASVEGFDYVVVNDDFESALSVLEAILTAERHRADRARGRITDELDRLQRGISSYIERNEVE
jgi:guanylate kinase